MKNRALSTVVLMVAALILGVSGCTDDVEKAVSDIIEIPEGASPVQVVVLDFAGGSLEGVAVTHLGSGETVSTNAAGAALFLDVTESPATFSARAEGGVTVYGTVEPVANEVGVLVLNTPSVERQTVALDANGTTEVTSSGVTFALPPEGSLVDASGQAYSGSVEVRTASMALGQASVPSPTAQPDGSVPAVLDVFDLSLFGSDGAPLQLADGAEIAFSKTLDLPQELSDFVAETGGTVALKRFDGAQGAWVDTGSVALAGSQLSGSLDHLSFFAVWNGAYFNVSTTVSSYCTNGSGLTPGAVLDYRFRVVCPPTRSVFDLRERATVDSSGTVCLKLPHKDGAKVTVKTPSNPAGTEHAAYVLPKSYTVGGVPQTRPTLQNQADTSGISEACSAGGTCVPLNPAAVSMPTCQSDTDCNDNNACTTDACDSATPCAPGTTCSGCSNSVVADGTTCDDGSGTTCGDMCTAGRCAGTPGTITAASMGSLTLAVAAGTVPVAETYDGPTASAVGVMEDPLETSGEGRMDFSGGAVTLVDNEPNPSAAGASPSMQQESVEDNIVGPATFTMEFEILADTVRRSAYLEMGASTMNSGASVQVVPAGTVNGNGQDEWYVLISSNTGSMQSPTPFGLDAGRVTFSFSLSASQITGEIAQNGSVVETLTDTSTGISDPFHFMLRTDAGLDDPGQASDTEIIRLHELTSDVSVTLSERWNLQAPNLSFNGVEYTTPGSVDRPGWLVDASGEIEATDSPISFDGSASVIHYHLIEATLQGNPIKATVYTTTPDASAILDNLAANGATGSLVRASGEAFVKQPSGEYLWALTPRTCQ